MDISYFLEVILPAIIAIIVAIVFERTLTMIISRYGDRRHIPRSQTRLINRLIKWSVTVVLIVVVASIFGIGIANLWATFAGMVAMVLIGFFAMWSILSNVLATVIVLLARPFSLGDKVTILPENLSGEAIDINLLYSKLKTSEGDIMTIPNITFLTKFISITPANK